MLPDYVFLKILASQIKAVVSEFAKEVARLVDAVVTCLVVEHFHDVGGRGHDEPHKFGFKIGFRVLVDDFFAHGEIRKRAHNLVNIVRAEFRFRAGFAQSESVQKLILGVYRVQIAQIQFVLGIIQKPCNVLFCNFFKRNPWHKILQKSI